MNLRPLKWNWSCITQGDTYPATNITETSADTTLSRVRVKIIKANATATALTLDSNTTGITLNGTSPGGWDFTIDEIPAATTATLDAGSYAYDLETTDSVGTVRTEFRGTWEIEPQVTT